MVATLCIKYVDFFCIYLMFRLFIYTGEWIIQQGLHVGLMNVITLLVILID